MIKLSKRMQAVFNLVSHDTVADIGCDHAFVSIALIEQKKARHVIAMDVKPGPVDIAVGNVPAHNMHPDIEVRLSDGFDALAENEAKTAIIAGMGGRLTVDILKRGRRHTKNGIELVLQPQSEIHEVRRYLQDIGYEITDELMVYEEEKYYTVIQAVPSGGNISYQDTELFFGPVLLKKRDNILHSCLREKYNKNKRLEESIENVNTDSTKQRLNELKAENELITRALSLIGQGGDI